MKTPETSRARSALAGATNDAKVGRAIKRLRRARGLSLDDVAARVGISPSFLSRLENGQRELTLATMTALAQAVGVTMAELVTVSDALQPDALGATPVPADTMAYLRAHAGVSRIGHQLLWIGQRWPDSGAAAMDASCALHAGLTAMLERPQQAVLQGHCEQARADIATRHQALVDNGEAGSEQCRSLTEVLDLLDRLLESAGDVPVVPPGDGPATKEGADAGL